MPELIQQEVFTNLTGHPVYKRLSISLSNDVNKCACLYQTNSIEGRPPAAVSVPSPASDAARPAAHRGARRDAPPRGTGKAAEDAEDDGIKLSLDDEDDIGIICRSHLSEPAFNNIFTG